MLLSIVAALALTPQTKDIRTPYLFWMKTSYQDTRNSLDKALTPKRGWEAFARTDGVLAYMRDPDKGDIMDNVSLYDVAELKRDARKFPAWAKCAVDVYIAGKPSFLNELLTELGKKGKRR
jgi:hypothetical protein